MTKVYQTHSLKKIVSGPSLPVSNLNPMMIAIDGGKSAILFAQFLNPTPMFQLHCIDNDPSLCIWNQLDFDLPFEARNPVAMMIPDEIVPNCN